jgi:hypothetical protein
MCVLRWRPAVLFLSRRPVLLLSSFRCLCFWSPQSRVNPIVDQLQYYFGGGGHTHTHTRSYTLILVLLISLYIYFKVPSLGLV